MNNLKMAYFKNYIIIILCLYIKASDYKILKKYGKLEDTGGAVIFESKDFSVGDKMFFKIKVDRKCEKDLDYKYYDNSEGISSLTDYKVSHKSSETTSVQGTVTSNTLFFTIEKKSSECKSSNGNYLFLSIDCTGKIDFENTQKDQTLLIIFIIVIILINIVFVIIFICGRRKKLRQKLSMNQPYIMYGNPQIYQQQGNIPIVYKGKPVNIVQPNGIPYNNNSNIQYSNLPYNLGNASMSQMNQPPNQKYNMIGQSSSDRGYNSNAINEKAKKK